MLRRRVLGIIRQHSRCYSAVEKEERREMMRTPVAEELASKFGNRKMIQKLFATNPNLKDSDIYFWNTFTSVLNKFGFLPRDCFRMIGMYPSILGHDEELLEKTLNEWSKQSRLGVDNLKFLILNRPEFLTIPPVVISQRLPFLLSYCQSRDTLMTLLFLCPNLMTEDWDKIIEKLEYLNREMIVYKSEILSSRALSKPLDFIKMRFSIVEKCGLYTKPNPHPQKQTQKERLKLRNPKLKDITDKADVTFARKVAKISLEEYEVYSNAYNTYREEETDDDDASDSSDEE